MEKKEPRMYKESASHVNNWEIKIISTIDHFVNINF